LREVYRRAGALPLTGVNSFEHGARSTSRRLDEPGSETLTFVHPRLQETALTWAEEQGAVTLRPAKAGNVRPGANPSIEIQHQGTTIEIDTRLVVGADGKQSGLRRWTGGETCADPELYRFGGVLVTGVSWDERTVDLEGQPERATFWFPISLECTRIYFLIERDALHASGMLNSFDTCLNEAKKSTPEGRLDTAVQAGPIAFFPNYDIWPSTISGDGITLIGDAAGSLDPAQGYGTSLLLRDVRELSEALIDDSNWQRAIGGYAERRSAYYDVLHTIDQWEPRVYRTRGPEGDRIRELNERAIDNDPTLGGWARSWFEVHGPDGLIPNEAARQHYFGEDL
jgi:2-polyprenyl-6-methoxyphenol hydroxylase-like FAD-dependent oxidoreductase